MLPALSERPSEERRTGAGVVGNDFTQRRGTGIHGDHAPRAETRNGTGLPLLSGRHSTAAGDCSIELGCLVRIVNHIASGVHFWKPRAGGCGRPILLGLTVAARLTALRNPIGKKPVQENELYACTGNSSARPPGDAQKKQLNAGAGALGVGTQHFRAAGDIGNSSARPPGNAQKKQLKDTPK